MNSMKKFFVAALVLLGIAGCTTGKENSSKTTTATEESKKLQVVTTNSIIYDMTKNIAGDLIDLHSIVPIGQDPHEYEPLPEDVQDAMIRTIPGLEDVVITRPAYAVDYMFLSPTQLDAGLQTRRVKGFFLAGQVNGTSGYEEAGGQTGEFTLRGCRTAMWTQNL